MARQPTKLEICERLVEGLVAHGYDNVEDIQKVIWGARSILNQGTGLIFSEIDAVIEKTLEGR